MLFKSPVFSQASGSIAGLVYSHNRGGMYTRNRTIPTDPSTERQQTLRAILGSLAPYWSTDLTENQRTAWRTYAANVAMTNRLGDTVYLTGQQHFLRTNVPRLQASIAILEDAPTVFDLGSFTAPTIDEADATSNELDIAFNDADEWATDTGGYLLLFCGKATGPGRAYYRGPWRYSGQIAGAVVPPSSPASISAAFTLSAGNNVWAQARIIQLDGRMSLPIILGPEPCIEP